MLSSKQKLAVDLVKSGKNVFITGPAGTGKSYIIEHIKREIPKKIVITSSTGISALNIKGKTLHSWAGIGLGQGDTDDLLVKISKSRKSSNWRKVDILVIDEISMIEPSLFDKLEEIARLLRRNEKPFGGIQLILMGDFYQLPPVCKDDEQFFCFEAESWDRCINETVCLNKIFRQTDPLLQEILCKIRVGEITDDICEILRSRMIEPDNEIIKPSILYSQNRNVDRINQREVSKLGGKVHKYIPEITINPKINLKSGKPYKVSHQIREAISKYLLKKDKELNICLGCQVMLNVNLDQSRGLVNGSRGIVIEFSDGLPIVRFNNGECVKITHYESEFDIDNFNVVKSYLPLQLAWAITIHKSQGSTLDYVKTNLSRRKIFCHGQSYTALSRVKSLDGLFIEDFSKSSIICNPKVKVFYSLHT